MTGVTHLTPGAGAANAAPAFLAYVINLPRDVARLQGAREELGRAQIAFETVPGVDGLNLSKDDLAAYDPRLARRRFGRLLLAGQIGCALGHRRALQRFLQSEAAVGLVCEDDLACGADLGALCQEVLQVLGQPALRDWNVVNLSQVLSNRVTELDWVESAGLRRRLLAAHSFPARAQGCLWSRSGAAQFLQFSDRIYAPLDLMVQDFCAKFGGGFCLSPPPVAQREVHSVLYAVSKAVQREGRSPNASVQAPGPILRATLGELRNLRNLVNAMCQQVRFRRRLRKAKRP